MPQSLTDKTISGLNWNFVRNYSTTISTLIIGVILARLLSPQDFGLLGMVSIFIGFADLFATLGMGQSVIRIKDLSINHIRTATTITIISSLIIFLIFYFTADLIADFYNEQRLVPIIKILSLLFVIKGITTVSYGRLTKSLNFRSIAFLHIYTSVSYGVVSAALALLNFGVWSLVYGQFVSTLVTAFLTIKKFPVTLRPLIKKEELKELAGFGAGVSLSSILLYGSSNIDLLIIGKLANPFSLGLYSKAVNLMTNSVDRISGGMSTVLFPVFSMVQDEKEKLRNAYLRAIRTATFFLFPILSSMIITSDYIINGLYGTKWGGAVAAFQILALGGILRSTLGFSGVIAHATGRVYAEASQQLVYFIILLASAYYGIRFGIEGVAFAMVIALTWMFFAQSYLAIKIVESSWKEFFNALIPGIANLIIMTFINLILIFCIESYWQSVPYEIKLLITLFFNLLIFLSAIIIIPHRLKGDTFDWILEKYKRFIPKKFVLLYYSFNRKMYLQKQEKQFP